MCRFHTILVYIDANDIDNFITIINQTRMSGDSRGCPYIRGRL